MKWKAWYLLACATPLFLAAQLTTSEAYLPAPCSPGYKRVNGVCVLNVVAGTKFKAKTFAK